MHTEGINGVKKPMYGKHFEKMYTGSLLGAGAEVFALMGYVIAHQKPPDFTVEINPKLVSVMLGEPEDEVVAAVEFLCAPDPKSRSEKEGGRRLMKIGQFLYHVVNGQAYHGIKSQEELRAYWREKKRQKKEETGNLIDSSATEPKNEWAPTEKQLRLGKLFRRRPETRWSQGELKAYRLIGDISDQDLEILERYYTANIQKSEDYRRHDLSTLLNNFSGELDRARKFKPGTCF